MEPKELLSHSRFLNALARSLVADEHLAADLTQDTWVAALEHPPSTSDHLKAWLSKVYRNFLRMRQRGDSRRQAREFAYAPEEGIPSSAEIVAQEELRRKVVEAVLSLDEPYRSIIVLRYYKDLPHKEVARRLDMTIEAMRGRLKKGIVLLRARLDNAHGGSRKQWLAVMAPLAGLAVPDAVAGSSSVLAGAAVMSAKVKLAVGTAIVFSVSLVTFMMVQLGEMDDTPMDLDPPGVEGMAGDQVESSPGPVSHMEMEREPLQGKQENEPGLNIEKSHSFTIAGRTFGKDGHPLADVRVSLASSPDEFLAHSGSDGCFTHALSLERGVKQRQDTVVLGKPGYLTRQFECVLESSEKTLHLGDIVLERGASISGSVRDENRHGVAGAEVGFSVFKAQGAAMEGIQRRRGQGVKVVERTDAMGLFHLEEVPEGWICVWAREGDSLYTPSKPVKVHAGDTITDVEIILEHMAKDDYIAGQVLAPDGLPLPGADIRVIEQGFDGWFSNKADEEGGFTIRLYAKKPHSVEARDPDGKYDVANIEDVEPGTHDLVLKLKRYSKEVELHVATSGERFLEAIKVTSFSAQHGRSITTKHFSIDPSTLGNVVQLPVPNVPFFLRISANGFDNAESKVYYPETLPKRVDMVLQSLPGVQGRVVAGGAPIKGVKVGLYRHMEGELLVNDFLCRSLLQAFLKTTTDQRGVFDLGLNTSGTFYLRCEHEGFAPLEVGPLELDKNIGKQGLELKLPRGGSIEGEVLLPPGRDRAGIVVAISRGDGKPLGYRTGPDGYFIFEGLTPGPWQVEQREQMILPETSDISFGNMKTRSPVSWDCWVEDGKSTRFDLDLTGWQDCRITGSLTLDGAPPKGWTCQLEIDLVKGLISQDTLGLDGNFSFQVDDPGEYWLRLSGRIDDKTDIFLSDRITLIPGETAWSHDLSLGTLQVSGQLLNGHLYYKWLGPENIYAYITLPLGPKEKTVKLSLPVGHGLIVLRDASGKKETILRELEINDKITRVDLGSIRR